MGDYCWGGGVFFLGRHRPCRPRRAPPSGQALGPRQGGEFTIVFTPRTTGALQGSLTLGDRSYPLFGTGIDPPLPKPTVSLDLKQAASAQQGALIVRFDAPAQTSGTGTATLDF